MDVGATLGAGDGAGDGGGEGDGDRVDAGVALGCGVAMGCVALGWAAMLLTAILTAPTAVCWLIRQGGQAVERLL